MNRISLSPSTIARVLGVVAGLLVLASIGGQISRFVLGHDHLMGLVGLFYIDQERNVPTYFSVLLIVFVALLLALIAVLDARQGLPHASKWYFLAFTFLLMAFDEAFQGHDRLGAPIRAWLGDGRLGVFYFAWVIPAIALVVGLGLYVLKFLLHLPRATRFRFLVAAALYVGGAIGGELIAGRHVELHGDENWTYSMIATVEESLEMAGLIVFIWALLKYFTDTYQEVRIRFEA